MTPKPVQTEHRVAAFFDREAVRFPTVYEESASWPRRLANALFRRSIRLRYDRVMAKCSVSESARILDIGCGPGTYSIALVRAGAKSVVGIDFAPAMIDVARQRAARAGVDRQCEFLVTSLEDYQAGAPFDFVIAMGTMDYIEDAKSFVHKAASLTSQAAFFSFPKKKGFLDWQRRMRYRRRCPLFMYNKEDLDGLFGQLGDCSYAIESIARDWFVILKKNRHR